MSSRDLFGQHVREAEETVARARKRSNLIRLFTLGILSGDAQQAEAEEALRSAKQDQEEYVNIRMTADRLDDELLQFVEIAGVRVSKNTFSDLPAFGHSDYPPNWQELRQEVLARDNYACQLSDGHCDGHLQIHHKQEISKGGSHALDNLQLRRYRR